MASKQWELKNPEEVARALEWIRKRTGESALVLVAIGRNHIAFVKHPNVSPRDAVELIENNLTAIHAGFERAKKGKA